MLETTEFPHDVRIREACVVAAAHFNLSMSQRQEWTTRVLATVELEGERVLHHLNDLVLAFAAAHGTPEAVRALEAEVIPAAALAVARIDADRQFVEEVLADLRSKLLVGAEETHPLLSYLGLGPLSSWFQVGAMRIALTLKRKRARDTTLEEELVWLEVGATGDIEAQIATMEAQSLLRKAMKAAAFELEPRERNLLRLYHVEDVTSETLATMYGVHRATIARWLSGAHEALLKATKRHLRNATQMSDASLESLVHAARADVFLNASSVLGPS